jgi:tryptophanyl-tRNA synthetase
MLADLHEAAESCVEVEQAVLQMVADVLACGLDGEKTSICLESHLASNLLPFMSYLSELVSLSRIQRLPAIKVAAERGERSYHLSFFNIPILEAIDILAIRAECVCANEDNRPFVELTRELAHKLNKRCGNLFPEPTLVTGALPFLVGTDGSKMSKARGNCIFISDPPDVLRHKVMKMYTDPVRLHADVPGDPTNNPVFIYHRLFNPRQAEVAQMDGLYRSGGIKDVEVKQRLVEVLEARIAPIRERSKSLLANPKGLLAALKNGTVNCDERVAATVDRFREAVGKRLF